MKLTQIEMVIVHLVGGIPTPRKKYEFVNWDDEMSHFTWKIQKSSKPPTSHSDCKDLKEFHPTSCDSAML